jgi:hypothetical protein
MTPMPVSVSFPHVQEFGGIIRVTERIGKATTISGRHISFIVRHGNSHLSPFLLGKASRWIEMGCLNLLDEQS